MYNSRPSKVCSRVRFAVHFGNGLIAICEVFTVQVRAFLKMFHVEHSKPRNKKY